MCKKTESCYNLRYVAQFVIEAETPLNLSSGEQDALTDSLVMTDANGLPMIPGTSLCGVLRHAFADVEKEEVIKSIFGYQGKGNDGKGSRLIVSNAHFVNKKGVVIEGLENIDLKDEFFANFAELPIRDHCKISDKGTSIQNGKFDNQVVYKGTRFKFEIELIGDESESNDWIKLLSSLSDTTFRIGGGTRKGYGEIKVVSAKHAIFDLSVPKELDAYLNKSAKLADELSNAKEIKSELKPNNEKWIKYELKLTPEDFYSFGSGFGDNDVDMTPVYEDIIEWNNEVAQFAKKKILIPASSIKGAISHRVAFHYNKKTGVTADGKTQEQIKECIGENNTAVKALFGFAKDSNSDEEEKKKGKRGNLIISDLFVDNKKSEKILNHVAIDRFTGGAMDGALFDEKVITQKDELSLNFLVNKTAFETDKVKEAFEASLDDIKNGMLPLGGSTMRGHGSFTGKWEAK